MPYPLWVAPSLGKCAWVGKVVEGELGREPASSVPW